MPDSKQHVKHFFGERVVEWAAHYADPDSRGLGAHTLISRQQFALDMVGPADPRPLKVLDVGCGTGEVSAKLLQMGHDVWGLDLAEPMVRHARARFGSDQFEVGDIEHMPFEDDSFDVVVCLGVIEYLASDEHALREIRRVLKPGGRAVVSTPSAISPLHHMDRAAAAVLSLARPVYRLAKYRLAGREYPVAAPISRVGNRRYHRGSWTRLLRSSGFEPDEWICHGWGWYKSEFYLVARFMFGRVAASWRGLERVFGPDALARARARFVRNRAVNWLGSEQIVLVRAIKSATMRLFAIFSDVFDLIEVTL